MPKKRLASVPVGETWFWQEHGACQGFSDVFFHPPNERGSARIERDAAAVSICQECPVRAPCGDYAMRSREPFGVWGGLTEEQRHAILRSTSAADAPRARGSAAVRFVKS